MLEETVRLADTVEGLPASTRLDAGEALTAVTRFDLSELVTSTAEQRSLLAEEKRIALRLEAPPSGRVEIMDGLHLNDLIFVGNRSQFHAGTRVQTRRLAPDPGEALKARGALPTSQQKFPPGAFEDRLCLRETVVSSDLHLAMSRFAIEYPYFIIAVCLIVRVDGSNAPAGMRRISFACSIFRCVCPAGSLPGRSAGAQKMFASAVRNAGISTW